MSKSPLRRVPCQEEGQLGDGRWGGGQGEAADRRQGGTAERDRMKGESVDEKIKRGGKSRLKAAKEWRVKKNSACQDLYMMSLLE